MERSYCDGERHHRFWVTQSVIENASRICFRADSDEEICRIRGGAQIKKIIRFEYKFILKRMFFGTVGILQISKWWVQCLQRSRL